MKKSIFTLVLFAIGTTLFAQIKNQNTFGMNSIHKMKLERIQKLTNSHFRNSANKTTEQKQRVIAQSIYEANNLEDSTTYAYSETRGSNFDFYNLDFTYSKRFKNDIPIAFSENSTDVLADTIKNFSSSPSNNEQYIGFYGMNNQLDSYIVKNNGGGQYKQINVFNSSEVLESTIWIEFNPNPIEAFKTEYIYESNTTKLLSDSSFHKEGNDWKVNYYTIYHYNSLNQIDSILEYQNNNSFFEINNITILGYDRNNNLDSFAEYTWTGSSFKLNRINSMTHHSSYNGFSTCKWTEYEDGIPNSTVDLRFILGSNNLPDSIIGSIYEYEDSLETTGFITYTYNKSNSLIKIEQHIGDHLGEVNFYYEDYNATGIKMAKNPTFSVFPNPISNKIVIQNTDSKLSGKWSISLADIQGRIVHKQQKKLQSGQNEIIIHDLPSGIYILNLESEEHGVISKKLIKQ